MPEQQQTLTIQQALDLAVGHHDSGRLSDAESIYQQILQVEPNHPIALHLLGVIAHQLGKNDLAVELITKALDIKPDFADAHYNLGTALQGLGNKDGAVSHYRKAIDFKPNYPKAHYNLGVMLQGIGNKDEAISHYRKAIDLKPDFAEAYSNLGSVLQIQGDTSQAMDLYRKATDINPGYSNAHHNLGAALQELGCFEAAICSYDLADLVYSHVKSLECFYALERYESFYQKLDELIEMNKANIRAAAISAFVSNQLNLSDPYPFCKRPLDFIRVYEKLEGLGDIDGITSRLVDKLNSLKADWMPDGKSTRSGFQTPSDLFENPKGPFADLQTIIESKIEKYRSEFNSEDCDFIKFFPKKFILKSWGVRLLKGGYQAMHIHPHGWLSGVCYLQMPKSCNQQEGSIEFSLWGENYKILNKNYPKKQYFPQTGDVVLFPSSLFHGTIPFQSNEERWSIAFDLAPA